MYAAQSAAAGSGTAPCRRRRRESCPYLLGGCQQVHGGHARKLDHLVLGEELQERGRPGAQAWRWGAASRG
jgi:hypothetical protein